MDPYTAAAVSAYGTPQKDNRADPDHYAHLRGMPPEIEEEFVDCICAATGIHPDDLDSDDWVFGLLVQRLADDYVRFDAFLDKVLGNLQPAVSSLRAEAEEIRAARRPS